MEVQLPKNGTVILCRQMPKGEGKKSDLIPGGKVFEITVKPDGTVIEAHFFDIGLDVGHQMWAAEAPPDEGVVLFHPVCTKKPTHETLFVSKEGVIQPCTSRH